MPPSPPPPEPSPTAKRLGIFGGSFDPVHNGHLALAEACRDQQRLDEVWLVPTAVQPLKPHGPTASDVDRLEMLELAVAGREGLVVSPLEINRGGVSYTAQTLREVAGRHPGAELFLLMGADTLHDLPKWREPEVVLSLATLLVVCRPGHSIDFSMLPTLLSKAGFAAIDMPETDVSSSGIRQRLAEGETIDGMVPEPVARYLAEQSVYD